MSKDLLADARKQADDSAAAVKTAALLHIARVLARVQPAQAAQVLDEALALVTMLPEDDRDILVGEAAALSATVSPQRAFRLAREVSVDRESILTRVLFNMLEHGYVADAVAYLSAPVPGEAYPFDAALQAIGRSPDDGTRLRIFRGAIHAMHDQRSSSGRDSFHRQHHFMRLFTYHWKRLPADEARALVRELVQSILSEPDQRTNATFSSGSHTVHFSSTHEQHLFEILGPLRHLDPDLAASIVKDYPQLSAAAKRFPYGQESMSAAIRAEAPPIPSELIEQPDYIDVGRRLIPISEAIRTEFKDAFDVALDLYAADSDSEHFNDVPQECWSSALEFRKILYKAGEHEGAEAVRYLDRIPDPALSLFAQIELAAALVGLPQLGGRTIRPGPGGLRDMMRTQRRDTRVEPAVSPAMRIVPPPRKPNLPPSRELLISPAALPAEEEPSGGSGPDFVEIRNAPLKPVVSTVWDMPETRIDWPSSLDPDARYDFVLVLPRPESHGAKMHLVQDGIAKHFRLRIAIEVRPQDVYVLTAPNGVRARPVRAEPLFEFGSIAIGARSMASTDIGATPRERAIQGADLPGAAAIRLMEILDMPREFAGTAESPEALEDVRRRIRRQLSAHLGPYAWIGGIEASLTMKELCETIEGGLDRPLVDETNLADAYAISVHTEVTTTTDFLRALSDKLGLVTTSARRDVRTLVVRPQ